MRAILFFAFCLLSFLGQAQKLDGIRAETYFIDLGQAQQNEKKSFQVVLQNHSSQTEYIRDVKGTCSCLKVEQFPDSILPSEKAIIEASMTSGSKGELLKYLEIISSGQSSYQKLGVKLRVE